MLKICLNAKYKPVLGELSRQLGTGSIPGHWAHKGSSSVSWALPRA